MSFVRFACIALLLAQNTYLNAAPQSEKYMIEKPVKRLALVLANSSYLTTPIDSANLDKIAVVDRLEKLGFIVRAAENFKSLEQLDSDYLTPFLNEIGFGDFVVVYYSGHGMSFSGENFIVPTRLPNTINRGDFFEYFISVEEIQRKLSSRQAGVGLVVFDACRVFSSPVLIDEDKRDEDVEKGTVRPKFNIATNFAIGYAAEPGSTAIARLNKMSVFTEALVEELDSGVDEFNDLKRGVTNRVKVKSNDKQSAWFHESLTAIIRLRETDVTRNTDRAAWINALTKGTHDSVKTYLRMFPISRYSAVARDWIRDNPNAGQIATTSIPPVVIAESWNWPQSSSSYSYADVSAHFKIAQRDSLSDMSQAAAINSFNNSPARDLARVGEYLSTSSVLVTNKKMLVRLQPSSTGRIVSQLPINAELKIKRVVNTNGGSWIETELPSRVGPAYIAAPEVEWKPGAIVGAPLAEGEVRVRTSADSALVYEEDVDNLIYSIGRNIKRVTWASIETGKLECKPPDVSCDLGRDLSSLRTLHVERLLEEAGINRSQITSLADVLEIPTEKIRIRLFASGGSDE